MTEMRARYPNIEALKVDVHFHVIEVLEGPSRGAQFFIENELLERFYEEAEDAGE